MPRRTPSRTTAWAVALSGTRDDRLAVARDPAATAADLAAVAPTYHDSNPDPELVDALLRHPNVPAGVVSRYTHVSAPSLRLAVAEHPRCPATALEVLALDADPAVVAAARAQLDRQPPAPWPHGPVSVQD